MNQIFSPEFNTISRMSVIVILYIVISFLWSMAMLDRANYTRRVNEPVAQPVLYSHQLHVGSLNMDCRYCHSTVDTSPFANIPATETCMTCHHEIKTGSVEVQKLQASYNNDERIHWIRVHDLADVVYLNHSIHVSKGIGCSSCHGRIDQMEVVWRENNLTMGWCLDCHRAPQNFIRPREEVYNMAWETDNLTLAERQQLVQAYNINVAQLEDCNVCHR